MDSQGNVICPHCKGVAAVADPSSAIGIRRANTAGSIRLLKGATTEGQWIICCCECGCDFIYDEMTKTVTEVLRRAGDEGGARREGCMGAES